MESTSSMFTGLAGQPMAGVGGAPPAALPHSSSSGAPQPLGSVPAPNSVTQPPTVAASLSTVGNGMGVVVTNAMAGAVHPPPPPGAGASGQAGANGSGPNPGGQQLVVPKPAKLLLWDPLHPTTESDRVSVDTLLRIKRDLSHVWKDPIPGAFFIPEDDSLVRLHAIVTGPFETPYEGGFFHFFLRFPPDYPFKAPQVRIMTTAGGTVRFNPNLYANGKVCLSLLGTWSGPEWSPALSLSSLFISIQSLMNSRPYHNEPGFEREQNSGDAERYNRIIQHETIRVAVLDHLEASSPASPLAVQSVKPIMDLIQMSFLDYFDHYVDICEKYKHLDGSGMNDPFGDRRRGRFQFGNLLTRLGAVRERLLAQNKIKDDEGESLSE